MRHDVERASGRGTVTGGTAHQPFDYPAARPSLGGRPHGKVSSWAVAAADVAAFLAGGTGLIMHYWWLFWVCVGVVVLSVPAGWAMRMMDDTVVLGSTPGGDAAALPGRARDHARELARGGTTAGGQPSPGPPGEEREHPGRPAG